MKTQPDQTPSGGGATMTYSWALRRIGEDGDLRLLDAEAKLVLLIYAEGPRANLKELQRLTGMPMTRTKAAFETLRDAGVLEDIARYFYGDQFDTAVERGWE